VALTGQSKYGLESISQIGRKLRTVVLKNCKQVSQIIIVPLNQVIFAVLFSFKIQVYFGFCQPVVFRSFQSSLGGKLYMRSFIRIQRVNKVEALHHLCDVGNVKEHESC
jgi:hypothetical protein